jgi:chromosome segregation ATPase
MSDASNAAKNLRERLSGTTEDRLGRALEELLESPLLTGAIGRAFDVREKAAQAQEAALGALNIPSAADIERLTRRLRSVSHRLEGIEEGVDRLDRSLSPGAAEHTEICRRLEAIEAQLTTLTEALARSQPSPAGGSAGSSPSRATAPAAAKSARKPASTTKRTKAKKA